MSDYSDDPIVPDAAAHFVRSLHRSVTSGRVYDLQQLYESEFNKITDRHFKAASWPSAESVSEFAEGDEKTLVLYKELYFRHIYAKMQPTIDDRFDSFQNYIDLFNLILGFDANEPEFTLPSSWIWEIIDEFIYQFQSFLAARYQIKELTPEDISLLKDHPHVWSPQTIIRYLHALVRKAAIQHKTNNNNDSSASADASITSDSTVVVDDSSNPVAPFFKTLGYFSLVGLLRVNVLLCDYASALRVLDPIDLRRHRSLFTQVLSCHVTLYFYLGFSYLMTRRYVDAIKIFSYFLTYISRNKQIISRSYTSQDLINKRVEQMLGLLAMSWSLSPENLDESILNDLREKFGEKLTRMQKGEIAAFAEIFHVSCPKFLVVQPPNYEALAAGTDGSNSTISGGNAEGTNDGNAAGSAGGEGGASGANAANSAQVSAAELRQHQWRMLETEIKQRSNLPEIYSYLKLFTSITTAKLGSFLKLSEDEVVAQLLKLKHKIRQVRWQGGSPNSGKWLGSSEVDFVLEGNMVVVIEHKGVRRYGDFFIRHSAKLNEINRDVLLGTSRR